MGKGGGATTFNRTIGPSVAACLSLLPSRKPRAGRPGPIYSQNRRTDTLRLFCLVLCLFGWLFYPRDAAAPAPTDLCRGDQKTEDFIGQGASDVARAGPGPLHTHTGAAAELLVFRLIHLFFWLLTLV